MAGASSVGRHQVLEDMNECIMCGGPVLMMGVLGDRQHGRCRNCGVDQSVEVVGSLLTSVNVLATSAESESESGNSQQGSTSARGRVRDDMERCEDDLLAPARKWADWNPQP